MVSVSTRRRSCCSCWGISTSGSLLSTFCPHPTSHYKYWSRSMQAFIKTSADNIKLKNRIYNIIVISNIFMNVSNWLKLGVNISSVCLSHIVGPLVFIPSRGILCWTRVVWFLRFEFWPSREQKYRLLKWIVLFVSWLQWKIMH